MWRNFFDGPHLIVIVIVLIVLFGWKKLPDIARSLGRSARILRSEADEYKAERRGQNSSAAGQTVPGETTPNGQQTPQQGNNSGGVRDQFQQGMNSFRDGYRNDQPQNDGQYQQPQYQQQPQEGYPQGYPQHGNDQQH